MGRLLAKLRSIQTLNNSFSQALGADLIPHCRVGYYHQGILILFTDSPARATQIRYQTPHLLSKLRTYPQWAGLCSIQIKVQTKQPIIIEERSPPISEPRFIPEEGRAHLQSLANDLKDKPGMKSLVDSLERLANKKANNL